MKIPNQLAKRCLNAMSFPPHTHFSRNDHLTIRTRCKNVSVSAVETSCGNCLSSEVDYMELLLPLASALLLFSVCKPCVCLFQTPTRCCFPTISHLDFDSNYPPLLFLDRHAGVVHSENPFQEFWASIDQRNSKLGLITAPMLRGNPMYRWQIQEKILKELSEMTRFQNKSWCSKITSL